MSVILNIRGTNGSGKSTLVRQLMERLGPPIEIAERSNKVWAYELQHNIRVLGRYETACGGLDAIKEERKPGQAGFHNTRKGIALLASLGHVLCEGVLWSTVFKSSDLIARELPQHHFIFGMLDTPAEECVRRVQARRLEKGNTKPFNPAELLSKVEQIGRRHKDLEVAGWDVRIIPWQDAVNATMDWLGGSGCLS